MAEPHSRFRIGDIVPVRSHADGLVAAGRGLFDVDAPGVVYLCHFLPDVSHRVAYAESRIGEMRLAEPVAEASVPPIGPVRTRRPLATDRL